MFSFVLLFLVLLLIYVLYRQYNVQKEGLGTQNKLPAYFSPFTLNNIPLKMTYWSNRLNGDGTTGSIDPYTVANDLKTTARTLNIVLYGDENGVSKKFIGIMSSIPFTINNLPVKMNVWANRLNGDPTGGTTDPQSIAYEIQYSSFLLNQALNGGATGGVPPSPISDSEPEVVEEEPEEEVMEEEPEEEEEIMEEEPEPVYPPITPYHIKTPTPVNVGASITPYHIKTTTPVSVNVGGNASLYNGNASLYNGNVSLNNGNVSLNNGNASLYNGNIPTYSNTAYTYNPASNTTPFSNQPSVFTTKI